MLVLYAIAIFVGAALLFLVQPMTAREVLPVLGGGPSVWTTCMVFFQCTLLVGYLYAHLVTSRLRPKGQVGVHLLVVAGAVALTFLAGRPGGAPDPGAWPVPWLLMTLVTSVGAGFFVLSCASPLLQGWFARAGHARSSNPYFLYVASNAGSLLGLLAYPFLLEPTLALQTQRSFWAYGFVAFAVLVGACAIGMLGRSRPAPEQSPPPAPPQTSDPARAGSDTGAPPITWKTRARWVFLAFVPSSLMLGVTSYLTSDIAVFPLLWVIPLALYLVSFMIAFSRFGAGSVGVLGRMGVIALIVLVMVYAAGARKYQLPSMGIIAVHLAGFAIIATWIHAKLASSAPRAERLTEFYLLMSVGGALGGVFNALIAPQIFLIPVEYTLVLAAAALARPWSERGLWAGRAGRHALILLPVVYLGAVFGADALIDEMDAVPMQVRIGVAIVIPAVFALLASRHGVILAMVLGLTGAVTAASMITREGVIYFERSFFGTMRIVSIEYEKYAHHSLFHGSTTHGAQVLAESEAVRRRPLTYYTPTGPAGDAFVALHERRASARVAVVGLGTGALAAYTRPGDDMVFYEIDPAVARIARDPQMFTYLADARGDVSVVLGDGRRSIADAGPTERYDMIVLDAFSSDAVPVHLLTREAMRAYFDRLKPGGFVLVHISNRYVDLVPVVVGVGESLGATPRARQHDPNAQETQLGASMSTWAVIEPPSGEPLALPPGWVIPAVPGGGAVWTDDYSDIVSLINWTD